MHNGEVLTMRNIYVQMLRICLILLSLSWFNLCLAWPWDKLWHENRQDTEDYPWEEVIPSAIYDTSEPNEQLDTDMPLRDIDFSTLELEELYPYKRTSIHSKPFHFGLNGNGHLLGKRPGK